MFEPDSHLDRPKEAPNSIWLPEQYSLNYSLERNPIQQLLAPGKHIRIEALPYSTGKVSGNLYVEVDKYRGLVVSRSIKNLDGFDEVFLAPQGLAPIRVDMENAALSEVETKGRWLKPAPVSAAKNDTHRISERLERIRASWRNRFFLKEEDIHGGVATKGLRPAQVGAIHATLAHWKVSSKAATLVMPTGTGKTETMLALLVGERIERLLVIVPTETLREQLARKFLTLGILKELGIVGPAALYPVVGTLEHRPRGPQKVQDYFSRCNVIVTTMSVVGGCSEDIQAEMAKLCTHLFIDEAHHVPASTWKTFRKQFEDRVILQFTATPFRNDKKYVDGKTIFNYPLRLAQRDQCFQKISFLDVFEVDDDKSDLSIALAAISTLTNDRNTGLDHILLARATSIPRAEQIYELYKEHASEYNPVLVHSKLRPETKRLAIQQVRKGESRVVVCVDMFGEGFDLPQLKIAAMHDLHKSLAITLQFIGRFTRTTPNIGEATMVANSVTADFSDVLRELYAEDVDWNLVLRNLSEGATEAQQKQSDFLSGFTTLPENFPVQTILPKMSTVVYRDCEVWQPDKVADHINEARIYVEPTMHPKHKVLLFVTKDIEPLPWADYKDLHNTVYNLYLLHWDAERKLLFINSSEKGGFHEELARAVGGDKAKRIKGEDVFRALHGINRILFMNVGVNSVLGKALSYTMYTGSDVQPALAPAQLQNKLKSNLFGRGYERGLATSMGCSYRGRLWSHRIAENIESWTEWCHAVATKLLDDTIKYEDIFKHVLIWETVTDRPNCVPLAVDWPSEFWDYNEDGLCLDLDGDLAPFGDVSLEILDPAKDGPLKFRIRTEKKHVDYRVDFADNEVSYVPLYGREVTVKSKNREQDIGKRFRDEPPKFYFENGGILDGTRWVLPQQQQHGGFPRENIRDDWDWTGITITKESQLKHDPMKLDKRKDSIQYRVIETLCAPTYPIQYDVVFDDDDAGESADVVGLKVNGDRLLVHLFHCKYSSESKPGARMGDLYVVCGQAQTSTEWKHTKRVEKLFEHLLGREARRRQSTQNKATRFEKGNIRKIHEIKRMLCRLTPEFEITIVQPGLSKKDASRDQLDLLAVTDLYLRETSLIPLAVIGSR